MRKRNKRDWTTFGLNHDNLIIEHCSGGTHPGTEQRAMCGRLMLSMVAGVFHRLNLGQPADE